MNGKYKFTPEMDRQIAEQKANGVSDKAIGTAFGVRACIVARRRRELGIAHNKPGKSRTLNWDEVKHLRALGMTHKEIAVKMGVSKSAIARVFMTSPNGGLTTESIAPKVDPWPDAPLFEDQAGLQSNPHPTFVSTAHAGWG